MIDPQQESRAALSGMGFNCLSSDRRLVESSVALSDMPVMLPPAGTNFTPDQCYRTTSAEGHDCGDAHRLGGEGNRKAVDNQRFDLVCPHFLKELRHTMHISLRAAQAS